MLLHGCLMAADKRDSFGSYIRRHESIQAGGRGRRRARSGAVPSGARRSKEGVTRFLFPASRRRNAPASDRLRKVAVNPERRNQPRVGDIRQTSALRSQHRHYIPVSPPAGKRRSLRMGGARVDLRPPDRLETRRQEEPRALNEKDSHTGHFVGCDPDAVRPGPLHLVAEA